MAIHACDNAAFGDDLGWVYALHAPDARSSPCADDAIDRLLDHANLKIFSLHGDVWEFKMYGFSSKILTFSRLRFEHVWFSYWNIYILTSRISKCMLFLLKFWRLRIQNARFSYRDIDILTSEVSKSKVFIAVSPSAGQPVRCQSVSFQFVKIL